MTRAWSLSHPTVKQQINEAWLLYSRAEWKRSKLQFPQANYLPRRTVFGIMIIPFPSCEIIKTKIEIFNIHNQLWNRFTVSDFCFGCQKCFYCTKEKGWKCFFLTLKLGTAGAETKIWDLHWNQDCDVVRNLLTFGHWKQVFSLFLIFERELFLILCNWENWSFAKEEIIHHKMYKGPKLVPRLAFIIKIFHFCWFVCLLLFVPRVLLISLRSIV